MLEAESAIEMQGKYIPGVGASGGGGRPTPYDRRGGGRGMSRGMRGAGGGGGRGRGNIKGMMGEYTCSVSVFTARQHSLL